MEWAPVQFLQLPQQPPVEVPSLVAAVLGWVVRYLTSAINAAGVVACPITMGGSCTVLLGASPVAPAPALVGSCTIATGCSMVGTTGSATPCPCWACGVSSYFTCPSPSEAEGYRSSFDSTVRQANNSSRNKTPCWRRIAHKEGNLQLGLPPHYSELACSPETTRSSTRTARRLHYRHRSNPHGHGDRGGRLRCHYWSHPCGLRDYGSRSVSRCGCHPSCSRWYCPRNVGHRQAASHICHLSCISAPIDVDNGGVTTLGEGGAACPSSFDELDSTTCRLRGWANTPMLIDLSSQRDDQAVFLIFEDGSS